PPRGRCVFGTEDQPGGVMRRPGQPQPGGPCDASAWPAADPVFVWDGGGMGSVIVPLPVDDLAVLRQRRSAKWRTYPKCVLPLTIGERAFRSAERVAGAWRAGVSGSDRGYAMPGPEFGDAAAKSAPARGGWPVEPGSVTAVPDVSVGSVELLRVCCPPGEAVVINPPVYPPFFDWVAEAGARLAEGPRRQDGPGGGGLGLEGLGGWGRGG